jgi:putative intracellular protease/amidase
MKLSGKRVIMLVTDGVDYRECQQLREGFSGEGAVVTVTTPQNYLTIETVEGCRRGRDLTVDLPLSAVNPEECDGLIIPNGVLSTGLLRQDACVLQFIVSLHQRGLPIFASGESVQLLYDSHVLSRHIVVREGSGALEHFIGRAIRVLVDAGGGSLYGLPNSQVYRPTI